MYEKLNSHIQSFYELIEKETREKSTPKIKGEITKGKLIWRGLRMIQQPKESGSIIVWVEQRGIRITDKFQFTVFINSLTHETT